MRKGKEFLHSGYRPILILHLLGSNGGGVESVFRDLHFGIMSTFVNVKIVCFAVIVNKDRNKKK